MKVSTNKGLENITKPFGYIDFNSDINLENGFLFNLQYTYTGAGTAGFLTFEPMHVFNARIQKTFFNEKL